MSTTTSPRVTDAGEHAAPTGPVARLVALGIAAGLVGAALLVLVVLPGAPESTVTGSFLVAFGLGWALTGWLVTRFTGSSMRWAALPAVTMTGAGAALLLLTPGDGAMRGAAWVWPVPTLLLAGFVWQRTRRSLPRRGRVLLLPVAAVLAVTALGAGYEDVSVVRDRHAYPPAGELHAVDGHELYLDCRGQGGPTVVLFNGLGEVAASWARVVDQVAPEARVCAYDRAGQGWSSAAAELQDGDAAADDLHRLLQVAGEHGPYVLVGHSTGGTFAMTYAARYPEQVAGMVLLDSSSPEQFTALPAYPNQYAAMRRGLAILPTLDRSGLGRRAAAVLPSGLPGPAADVVTSLTVSAHGATSGRNEVTMLPQVFADARQLTSLAARPLAVVTASESRDGTDGWTAAQDRLLRLSTNATHRVVVSSHAGLLEDAGPAAESAAAVRQVVDAVRTSAEPGQLTGATGRGNRDR